MTREEAFKEIKKIQHGQKWIWPESDYGKAEIWRLNNVYVLFGMPMYGGEPFYYNTYLICNISKLLDDVESWT